MKGSLEKSEEQILVSICVQTYQHIDYIKECLDSILMQQTSFNYEIVLGEDESTDGTREICIEYAEEYPDKIRLFLRSRKDVISINGRPTGRFNLIENLKSARGKYIALCEGDDYWTDPLKLQKQVDFLEAYQDYVICLHNSYVKFEDSDKPDKVAIPDPKEELTLRDFIDIDYFREKKGLISRGHTSSIVFKNHLIKEFPDWFHHKAVAGDLYLLMLLAQYGKGKFINELMSVYRVNLGGVTRASPAQKGHLLLENRMLMLNILNEHFQYQYNKLIRGQIAKFHFAKVKLYYQERKRSQARHHLYDAMAYSQNKLKMLKEILLWFGKTSDLIRPFNKVYQRIKGSVKYRLKNLRKK